MNEPAKKFDKAYWLESFHNDSAKFSDLCRQICFAGIAVIWIFRNTLVSSITDNAEQELTIIPKELITPIILMALSLMIDMIQYLYRTIVTRVLVQLAAKGDKEIDTHWSIEFFTWLFFLGKFALVLMGYIHILKFLFDTSTSY